MNQNVSVDQMRWLCWNETFWMDESVTMEKWNEEKDNNNAQVLMPSGNRYASVLLNSLKMINFVFEVENV